MTTVLGQELSRPPSPNDPEPRYLSYSSTPVVTAPKIDIQDDGDSGDVDISLTGEAHSATGSVVRLMDPLSSQIAICPIGTTASPFRRAKWLAESSIWAILIISHHFSNHGIGGFQIIWHLPDG